jgi:hypothetical protein
MRSFGVGCHFFSFICLFFAFPAELPAVTRHSSLVAQDAGLPTALVMLAGEQHGFRQV